MWVATTSTGASSTTPRGTSTSTRTRTRRHCFRRARGPAPCSTRARVKKTFFASVSPTSTLYPTSTLPLPYHYPGCGFVPRCGAAANTTLRLPLPYLYPGCGFVPRRGAAANTTLLLYPGLLPFYPTTTLLPYHPLSCSSEAE